MAQQTATETTVAQSDSVQKATRKVLRAFRRKEPLHFSPKRQYAVAVISPMQKTDSSEPVFADGRSSGTSSPPLSSSSLAETAFGVPWNRRESRHAHARQRRATHFQPFSFDARDAARKFEFEMKLEEMRQLKDQSCFTFKAHPVRRYKPLVQPPTHFKSHCEPK